MTVLKEYNPATGTWDPILVGVPGPTGPSGGPVPTGGTTGQQIVKTSSTDFAVAWQSKTVVDVRDYGAKGDGTTDDSAAFTAAIAAASAGAVIDLAGRSYKVNSIVTVNKTLTIRNGTVTAGAHQALYITAADCTLQNLTASRSTAVGADTLTTGGAAIGINAVRCRVLNCNVTNAASACVIFYNGTANYGLVQGGYYTNTSVRQGASMISAAAGPATNVGITVRDVTCVGTGCPQGITFFDATASLVSGCHVSSCRLQATVTLTGWTVASGSVYQCTDRTDGTTRILRRNGTVLSEDTAAPTNPASNKWGISGGLVYLNNAGTDPNTQTITSDVTSGYGILLYTTGQIMDRNIVSDCDVSDCDGFGIYLQLGYATASDNLVTGCHLTDVCLGGDQYNALPFAGIGVTGGRNTTIAGTTIRRSGSVAKIIHGIKVITGGLSTTSTGRIMGCEIIDATDYGIQLLGNGSFDWTISDAATRNCRGGIHVNPTDAVESRFRLYDVGVYGTTAVHGIQFTCAGGSVTRATVQDCEVYDAFLRGVAVTGATTVIVNGCKIRNWATAQQGLNIATTGQATLVNNLFENDLSASAKALIVATTTTLTMVGNVAMTTNPWTAPATTFYESGNSPAVVALNAQTGTTYAPVQTDQFTTTTLSNAAAITVTMPSNATLAIPVGASLDYIQTGAGQATFAAGSGATLTGTPGLKTRAQWSKVTATKTATNAWVLSGDTAA